MFDIGSALHSTGVYFVSSTVSRCCVLSCEHHIDAAETHENSSSMQKGIDFSCICYQNTIYAGQRDENIFKDGLEELFCFLLKFEMRMSGSVDSISVEHEFSGTVLLESGSILDVFHIWRCFM